MPAFLRRPGPALLPLLALLGGLLLSGGDSLARREKEPETPNIVLQARALAKEERLEGLALLEEYLAGAPSEELLPWVAVEAGEQRRLINDLSSARAHFQRVRACCAASPLAEAATLGLTLVDAGEHPSGNQLATLGLMAAPGAPPTMDADRQRLLALAATAEGERAKARAAAARARAQAEASGDELVQARVARSLASLPAEEQDAQVHGPLAPDPQELLGHALDRGWELLEDGDLEGARKAAEVFLTTFPESERAREAAYLVMRIDAQDRTDTRLIGVLLPLSGTYAPPGLRLKQVIEMANLHAGSPMHLVFLDTGGEPEHTVELLEQLVLERGAMAVMGPLLKEDASLAAEAAQALHVPLVSLSQTEGLTGDRPFVFRGFLTPVQQVRALVAHAMGPMGLTRFAVLAPENSYGRLAADAFATEVAERGGQVERQTFYDPTLGDFRKAAAELANKDYKARAWEFKKLKDDAEERGMDPDKCVLPPLVDYQGIFIPDSAQRVPLVASALAYEEFAIGAFKPRRDDEPLLLMGLNGWHDDQLAVSGGNYVRGSILVDAFDATADDPATRSFVEAFSQEFGSAPGVVDALGYDAARMVAEALRSGPTSRTGMRRALAQVELPDTISGGRRFDDQGEVVRQLRILEVGAEHIEPWRPPEEPEAPTP
ncbi:MAG: penicillin-binding protein activator [Pseudomonadota bacterium]